MKSASIKKAHPEANLTVIGHNLLSLRKAKGLTRADVAYHSEISLSTLYRLETGKSEKVGVWPLFDLCKYFGVDPYTVLIPDYYTER